MENEHDAGERASRGPRTRNTAVFIDMENLFGGYAGEVRGVPVKQIIAETRRIGAELGVVSDIAIMRAYANWADGRLSVYRRELMEIGIEPIQVFGFGNQIKNAADIELVVDALATVYDSPFIEVVVIVSGDGGFVPLVRHLHALGRYVLVVSTPSPPPNKLLRAVADRCHLVGDTSNLEALGGQPAKKASKGNRDVTAPAAESAKRLVRAAVEADPSLIDNGSVDTSRLGKQIRVLAPEFKLVGTGYRTLSALAGDALGDRVVEMPTGTKVAGAGPAQPTVQIVLPVGRQELREALHTFTRAKGFDGWFAAESTEEGLPSARFLQALDRQCPRFSSSFKRLFPVAKLALRYGLYGSGIAVSAAEDEGMFLVPEDGRPILQPLDEPDLASSRVLLEALARCTPMIRIPDPVLFGDAIESVVELVSRPTSFSSIVESCADSLEEWPADKVRISLATLATLRVLVPASEPQAEIPFEDRELVVNDRVHDLDDALEVISGAVDEALAPYNWPPANELIKLLAVEASDQA